MGIFESFKGVMDAHGVAMDTFLQEQKERARAESMKFQAESLKTEIETLKLVADSYTAAGRPVPPKVLEQMMKLLACGLSGGGGADSGDTPATLSVKDSRRQTARSGNKPL